jgi:hypothetical protein
VASPSPANDTGGQTSSSRYEALAVDRQPYLDRARDCSALTLPYLIPRDDDPNGKKLPSLYQSVGANGVTNLASKLLMTMLPPNEPCFRLRVNNMVMEQEVEDEGDREFQTKINKALSRVEQAVLADIESTADRPVVHEANMHLIVGGNVLFHNDGKSGLRMFPLSRYVVDRDSAGTPVEIIIRETVSIHTLPEDFLASLRELEGGTGAQVSKLLEARPGDGKDEVDIYTHLRREASLWKVRQEVFGHEVPGSTGSYKPEVCPWFPVRMYSIAGENYGRGFVEQQLGDLTSLESLNQAMVEGAIVSSKMLFFVEPNSVTSARAVAEASNGDVLEGRGDDVSCLQVQKGADFQVVAAKIQAIEQSLKTAFLMVDGMRRDKERVTAEEIRMIAQELEAGLGGVYTTVAQEFQLPYIRSRMAAMTKQKRLPELPRELVTPAIVTGFEAIGRGTDKNKLMEFLQAGATTFGDSFLGLLNPHNAVERLASAMGITTEGLVKTPEELQAEQEQAQQMAQQQSMMENLGPEAVRQGGGMLNQAFAANQQNSNGGNNG